MKKLVMIALLCILSIGLSNAEDLYQDNSQSTEIDNFDVNNAIDNVKDLKSSVDWITQELFSLDEKARNWAGSWAISKQYIETRKEIVNIINTINTTTENTNKILRQISAYKKEIINASEEVKASRSWMNETKEYISSMTQFLYKLDNKLYIGSGIDNIKLLTNSDNIPRTLSNDYMVQSILTQLNNLMNNLDQNENDQLKNMKKMNILRIQAKSKLSDYSNELDNLQQKKNYLLQFLWLYQKDKFQRQETITQLFQSTKGVYEKIQELIKNVKKWVYKVNFNIDKKIIDLNSLSEDKEAYPFAWPVYPIYDIETYFGDMIFQKQFGIPSLGIQIKAKQATPVYAARDWIVYFVADNDDIWINWTMIVHTDWYISVYQYLNRTVIKEWDIVKRGQLIGYSGWEPGTRWAWFISKWPNLSFSIFKDGVAIDPFDILDASQVQDKSVLPDWYQIKYLRDKYIRPIDITSLTIMTWETIEEREYQFLRLYGVGIYKNPQFREDAVKNTNIDRDVIICIAFAESTLGKYLSTANNIGNVWNDDSGNRVAMWWALAGARAIALTLNNWYLGEYHTIKQLSRYGNKDGKIYASSPINWQTNVLKCLSQIKWYYIPEDFPFRTGVNPNTEKKTEIVELLKNKVNNN